MGVIDTREKKVSPTDAAVVEMYRTGLSYLDISKKLGMAVSTVGRAMKRSGETARSNKDAIRLRVSSGRWNSPRYWKGKKQSEGHVQKRTVRGDKHYLWKGGTSDPRRYRAVVEKKNCARCGFTDKLAIHHLNNDHYDCRPENLQVLCNSCHSSVHKKAYWDAIHAGVEPLRSNAPINWQRQ